jgi:hypothetical protein
VINRCRRAPFLASYQEFSIFVCDCADWLPSQAELNTAARFTARDVATPAALFVADPFLARDADETLLFFELMPSGSLRGAIGLARSRDAGIWTYEGIVLDEPFHLSFPHVFQWQTHWFMVPECAEHGEVRLYRATSFPDKWEFERTLLKGRFADSVLWEQSGTWYMLTSPRMETLKLFLAETPLGPWMEHPSSPVVENDLSAARPGGPVVAAGRSTFRLAQDCRGAYGRALSAYVVEEIGPSFYQEKPYRQGPVLGVGGSAAPGTRGMHHLHALQAQTGRWTVACDGWRMRRTWAHRVLLPAIGEK